MMAWLFLLVGLLVGFWSSRWVPKLEVTASLTMKERLILAAVTGVSFAILSMYMPIAAGLVLTLLVTQALILIGFIDYKTQLIPDTLNGFIAVCGLILLLLNPSWRQGMDAAIGAIVGGGLMLITAIATRGAIGGGDVKLAFALGILFGAGDTLNVLLNSFVLAALYAIVQLMTKRKGMKEFIPLGPSIVLAALFQIMSSAMAWPSLSWFT